MKKPSDVNQTLITTILSGGIAADRALRQIYLENREIIGQLIKNNQGTSEEAKDVMQEAMIAFYENVVQAKFNGESKISTYLYSIARFIWLNRLKRKKLHTEKIEQAVNREPEPAVPANIVEGEQRQQMLELFGRLGEDCQRLLMDSIYHGHSMKIITQKMGYRNEQVTRNKKHLCLKKLKSFIQKHPKMLEFLK